MLPRMLEHDRRQAGWSVGQAAWELGISIREYRELETWYSISELGDLRPDLQAVRLASDVPLDRLPCGSGTQRTGESGEQSCFPLLTPADSVSIEQADSTGSDEESRHDQDDPPQDTATDDGRDSGHHQDRRDDP
jgi:hypothetical protein